MELHTHPEFKNLGFSGRTKKEFGINQFNFRLVKGSTNSGSHNRVALYAVEVSSAPNVYLFKLYAYNPINYDDRDTLYSFLDNDHLSDFNKASKILEAALKITTDPFQLIGKWLADQYLFGVDQGMKDVRQSIKRSLGIEE